MNISREDIGQLEVCIRIELVPEDYQENVHKKLKDYQRKANMPGFRPGMVPFGMINKLYGKSVLVDEVSSTLNNSLTEYINDQKLKTLGSPLANEEKTPKPDWDKPGNYEFYFDIGLAPDFEPDLAAGLEVNSYKIAISEEDIENEISVIRRSYGTFEKVTESVEGDWLFVELAELGATGEALEGGITNSRRVTPTTFDDAQMKSRLAGLKIGESLTINPKEVVKDAARIAYLLNIPQEQAETLDHDFRMTVKEIERLSLAELNRELFTKAFPNNEINTEEEFREQVRKDLESSYIRESESLFFTDVRKKLLETYNLPLPETFLKRWIKDRDEEDRHEHEHEHKHEHAEPDFQKIFESMRWQLIENRIIENYNLRVTEKDVKDYVKERYRQYFSKQAALPPDPEKEEETLNLLADKYVEKKEDAEQIYDMLYNERLIQLFKDNIQPKLVELSHNEFHQLTHTEH